MEPSNIGPMVKKTTKPNKWNYKATKLKSTPTLAKRPQTKAADANRQQAVMVPNKEQFDQ